MTEYTLWRVYLATETLGSMYGPGGEFGEFICKTLELPWKDNARAISCIPEGVYRVIYQPPKPGRDYEYFRLPDVPGRSGILIHKITYVKDLKGCIGVGSRFLDINKDGVPDMIESGKKLEWMIANMPKEFNLRIVKK